jgi:hypothetical protein
MPTEPVLPESELRARVLQCIEDGRLPVVLSTIIYAGYGQGRQCDLCDQPIACDKIEYDVTEPRGGGKWLHFHFACHSAWQRECAFRLRDFRPPSTQE